LEVRVGEKITRGTARRLTGKKRGESYISQSLIRSKKKINSPGAKHGNRGPVLGVEVKRGKGKFGTSNPNPPHTGEKEPLFKKKKKKNRPMRKQSGGWEGKKPTRPKRC